MNLKLKNEKLTKTIMEMIINERLNFFGEFSLHIDFHEGKVLKLKDDVTIVDIPTAGVNVSRKGFNFYYNPEWINSLDEKEIVFIMLHEICHLLFTHQKRTERLNWDHRMSNIAQDMIINNGLVDEMDNNLFKMPDGLLTLPKEYQGPHVFEPLYVWLFEQYDKYKQWKQGQGQGQGQQGQGQGQQGQDQDQNGQGQQGKGNGKGKDKKDESDDGCPVSKDLKQIFDNYEQYQFDVHLTDEVSEELKKMMGEEITSKFKNRGIMPGNIEKLIDRLQKKQKDYLKEIKSAVRQVAGIVKNKTFLRPNRKGITGLKGKIKNDIVINCILDTSGSMNGDFEKVLSYIFQNNIQINLIQCDTEVKDFLRIRRKKEFDKIKIKGLGGTVLQPGFDYIKNSKELNSYNTVVLTDGYCDTIDASKMQKVLVLSTSTKINFSKIGKFVKQIVIEQGK